MKADARTEADVVAVLNTVAQAYATRNMEMLLSTVAPDEDVIMYGTGADEKRIGRAGVRDQAQRDWSQTESATVTYETISVSAAGPVAWAAADAVFSLQAEGQAMTLPARITFVLERRGDQWLIVQAHYSFPAAGQEAGESFPQA